MDVNYFLCRGGCLLGASSWVPKRCFASLCTFAPKVTGTLRGKVTGTQRAKVTGTRKTPEIATITGATKDVRVR